MASNKKDLEWFDTYLGRSVFIDGRVVAGKSIRIDGQVLGNIESKDSHNKPTIAIGQSAHIKGNIYSHKVIIAGEVEGNVYAQDQVILNSTSSIKGDVSYRTLSVDQGAKVVGSMIMKEGIKAISHDPIELFQAILSKSKSK